MFSDAQLKLIAETLANIGLAFFAAMVIPLFLTTDMNPAIGLAGFSLALTTWAISLFVINIVAP